MRGVAERITKPPPYGPFVPDYVQSSSVRLRVLVASGTTRKVESLMSERQLTRQEI